MSSKHFEYYWLEGHDGFYKGTLSVAFASGGLSLFGSSSIILWIWLRALRPKKSTIFHRILLGLSFSDIMTTLSLMMTPFMLPVESGYPVALGNFTTCNVAGFLLQYYLSVSLYNCALSFYYVLMIVHGWSEDRIQRLMEPWVHIVCLSVPIIYGTLCILTDTINPTDLAGTCEFGSYPAGCLEEEHGIPCERGKNTVTISWGFVVILKVSALIGIINTIRVYLAVRKTSRRSTRDSMTGATERRLKSVAVQSYLYTFAFVNSFLWATAIRLASQFHNWDNRSGDNVILCVVFFFTYMFFPLQGFLNGVTFLRPRLQQYQQRHPEAGIVRAYCQIMSSHQHHSGSTAVLSGGVDDSEQIDCCGKNGTASTASRGLAATMNSERSKLETVDEEASNETDS